MNNKNYAIARRLGIVIASSIFSLQAAPSAETPSNWGEKNIPSNGIGPFISIDALLLKAHQNNLEFVLTSNADTDVQLYEGFESSPNFSYDWGCRLGLGYTFKQHDDLDLATRWTHFTTKADRTVTANSDQALQPILTVAYGGNYHAEQANSDWKLHLNMIDLCVGKQFPVSTFFNLKGFTGLQTGWIYQSYDVSYSGGQLASNENSPTNIAINNDFWGLGIIAGIETLWGFGAGISLYADAAVSLLSGFFDLKTTETIPSGINNNVSDSFKTEKPAFDFSIGLRWDKTFCEEKYHIALAAGWEHYFFPSQYQWQAQDTAPFTNTDLSLVGWTLNAQFDF